MLARILPAQHHRLHTGAGKNYQFTRLRSKQKGDGWHGPSPGCYREAAQFLRYWVCKIKSNQMKARLKYPKRSSRGRSPMKRKLVQKRFRSEPKMMMVPAVETKPNPMDTTQRMLRRVFINPLQPHCMRGTRERQAPESCALP